MIKHIASILRKHPLLAIEFLVYIKLIAVSAWSIHSFGYSLVGERNSALFGEYMSIGQHMITLSFAMIGLLGTFTNKNRHRINATMLGFMAGIMGALMAVLTVLFSGNFHGVTLITYVSSALILGAIHLNLRMEETEKEIAKGVVSK